VAVLVPPARVAGIAPGRRTLVSHLYVLKGAKRVRDLHLTDHDEPGFWESLGSHNHGDPW